MLISNKGLLSNKKINNPAIIAEAVQLIASDLLIFRAITSIANNQPANGLPNNTATPAVTPARSVRVYTSLQKSLVHKPYYQQ